MNYTDDDKPDPRMVYGAPVHCAPAPACCEMCGQTLANDNAALDATTERSNGKRFVAYVNDKMHEDAMLCCCVMHKLRHPELTVRQVEAWARVEARPPRRSKIADAFGEWAKEFPGLAPLLGKMSIRARAQAARRADEAAS